MPIQTVIRTIGIGIEIEISVESMLMPIIGIELGIEITVYFSVHNVYRFREFLGCFGFIGFYMFLYFLYFLYFSNTSNTVRRTYLDTGLKFVVQNDSKTVQNGSNFYGFFTVLNHFSEFLSRVRIYFDKVGLRFLARCGGTVGTLATGNAQILSQCSKVLSQCSKVF